MKHALVIGGFGFIGQNLTDRLLSQGVATTLLTPSVERHTAQADAFAARGAEVIEASVCDLAAVTHAVAGRDAIFNLSGQSGSGGSPALTLRHEVRKEERLVSSPSSS